MEDNVEYKPKKLIVDNRQYVNRIKISRIKQWLDGKKLHIERKGEIIEVNVDAIPTMTEAKILHSLKRGMPYSNLFK